MMNIKIYQINRTRDEDRIKFLGLDSLPAFQGNQDINSKIYDKVYQGSVEAASLEDVYRMFNTEHPQDFKGHSLSVSDVVEVVEGPEMAPGFYFCDCVGFQRVEFHPELTAELGETLQVVLLEPGKMAKAVEIDGSLQGLQKVVGGYIEASYPFEEQVCIVCNEEGKLNGMPLNRAVYVQGEGEQGERKMVDIIAGPCFICDCSGENFGSLSPSQMKKYLDMFRFPERFASLNGETVAIPYVPARKEQER